jgi:NAD(P)H-quinone oxidoreductase subunit 5
MSGQHQPKTVGPLPNPSSNESWVPAVLTRVVWALWVLCLGVAAVYLQAGGSWALGDVVAIDGLTVVMWVTATFLSGIVHSYSRRYMAGESGVDRFFVTVFAFTLVVMALVAADSFLVFGLAWLAMGLLMAELVGHVDGWPQAQAAGSIARRYFLGSTALLAGALGTLWWTTGATTVSGVAGTVTDPSPALLVAAGALVLAAMVQSALVPFHTWLLSSMTAPTPASALMHAGFVNAGGILLVRFAPVVTAEVTVMLAIVVVGAASALLGKLLKAVQTDIKSALGCSTSGQMGFMLLQAGLGFFAAAITHLLLHGFFKAYQFLAAGSRVEQTSPTAETAGGSMGVAGVLVTVGTALAGGALFALTTGKGTQLGGGLLLVLLVVLTVLTAARELTSHASAPAAVRYGGVPLVALPAIAVYAGLYTVVEGLLAGLPAVGEPIALTWVHGVVTVAFLVGYLAVETGVYQRSHRLYVALVNASEPATETLLTSTEDYNEY